MLNVLFGIIGGLCLVVIGWIAASFWGFSRRIDAEITRLEKAAQPNQQIVSEARLVELPTPVQRHLRQAGVVGQKIPTLVRLTQTGRIRSAPDANWMAFTATELYSTNPPGFVWRANFPSAALPIVFGRDHYLDGDGRITMKVLGTFGIANAGGGELNAAALMRYLNETMWFPAALADTRLVWTPVDDFSADVTLSDRGLTATARLFFDAEGRIVTFSAKRFNSSANSLQTWETPVAGYARFAGMTVPQGGQAIWQTPDGPFAYIELTVTEITLD